MAAKTQFFIKLFDERIAKPLCDGGFSYTQENVSVIDAAGNRVDKTLYCFVGGKKLERAFRKLVKSNKYGDVACVTDSLLRF